MNCPNCQADVKISEQNYGGLFTCPSCQAAYFINFEGKPEFGHMDPVATEQTTDELPDGLSQPETATSPVAAPDQNLDISDYNNASFEPIVDFNQNEFAVIEPLSEIIPDQLQDNMFESLQTMPMDQPLPPEQMQNSNSFESVAKDISDFGNSETQVASLNYDLKITGLDSIEILKLFKEAIDDSRFGWETNEMMRSIKNGAIKLEKLNPVKAYILSKRLQFLDIEKNWKQNVLS